MYIHSVSRRLLRQGGDEGPNLKVATAAAAAAAPCVCVHTVRVCARVCTACPGRGSPAAGHPHARVGPLDGQCACALVRVACSLCQCMCADVGWMRPRSVGSKLPAAGCASLMRVTRLSQGSSTDRRWQLPAAACHPWSACSLLMPPPNCHLSQLVPIHPLTPTATPPCPPWRWPMPSSASTRTASSTSPACEDRLTAP